MSTVIYLTESSTSKFHRFILCTVCLRANAFSHKTTSRKYNVSQRVTSKTPLCLRELRCYHAVTLLAVAQQNSNKRIWSWLVYQNWTHISTTDLTLHNAPLRNYNYLQLSLITRCHAESKLRERYGEIMTAQWRLEWSCFCAFVCFMTTKKQVVQSCFVVKNYVSATAILQRPHQGTIC